MPEADASQAPLGNAGPEAGGHRGSEAASEYDPGICSVVNVAGRCVDLEDSPYPSIDALLDEYVDERLHRR